MEHEDAVPVVEDVGHEVVAGHLRLALAEGDAGVGAGGLVEEPRHRLVVPQQAVGHVVVVGGDLHARGLGAFGQAAVVLDEALPQGGALPFVGEGIDVEVEVHEGHARGPHGVQQAADGLQLALAGLGVGEGLLRHPRRRQRRQGHALRGIPPGQRGQVPRLRQAIPRGGRRQAQHDVAHAGVAAEGEVAVVVLGEGGEDSDVQHDPLSSPGRATKDSHGGGALLRAGTKKTGAPLRRAGIPLWAPACRRRRARWATTWT